MKTITNTIKVSLCLITLASLMSACSKHKGEGGPGALTIDAPEQVSAFATFQAKLLDNSQVKDLTWNVVDASGNSSDSFNSLCSGLSDPDHLNCWFQEEGTVDIIANASLVNGQNVAVHKKIQIIPLSALEVQRAPAVAAKIFKNGVLQACYRSSDRVCQDDKHSLDQSLPLKSHDQYTLDVSSSIGETPDEALAFEVQIPTLSDSFEDFSSKSMDLTSRILNSSTPIYPGALTVKIKATGRRTGLVTFYRLQLPISCSEDAQFQLNLASPTPNWVNTLDGINLVTAQPSLLFVGNPQNVKVRINITGDGIPDQDWSDLNQTYSFFTNFFGPRKITVQALLTTCNAMKTFVIDTNVPRTTNGLDYLKGTFTPAKPSPDPLSFFDRSTRVSEYYGSKYTNKYQNRFSCNMSSNGIGSQIAVLSRNAFPEEGVAPSNLPYQDKRESSFDIRTAYIPNSVIPEISYPRSGSLPAPMSYSTTLERLQYNTDELSDFENRMSFFQTGCPVNLNIEFVSDSYSGGCTVCTKSVSVDYMLKVEGKFSCDPVPELKFPDKFAMKVTNGEFKCNTLSFKHVTQPCNTYDYCACNPCAAGCPNACNEAVCGLAGYCGGGCGHQDECKCKGACAAGCVTDANKCMCNPCAVGCGNEDSCACKPGGCTTTTIWSPPTTGGNTTTTNYIPTTTIYVPTTSTNPPTTTIPTTTTTLPHR